jgi:hypothetical protein
VGVVGSCVFCRVRNLRALNENDGSLSLVFLGLEAEGGRLSATLQISRRKRSKGIVACCENSTSGEMERDGKHAMEGEVGWASKRASAGPGTGRK